MLRRLFCLSLSLASLACREATAPLVRHSLPEILTDRADYQPGDVVIITVRNDTEQDFYDDHCSGSVEGFYHPVGGWNGSFGMARICLWPDPAAWRSYSRRIAPQTTHRDTMWVNSSAYEGDWRVHLRLRDSVGTILPESASVSNTFRVYRP